VNKIETLEYIISTLPGLGSRSARRIVIEMLLNKSKFLKNLPNLMLDIYDMVLPCNVCGKFCENNICEICNDSSRDKSILCIVEGISDLLTIEKSKYFNGLYHILMGRLSAIDNITPEKLNITSLEKRIINSSFNEIIIANSSTVNGQTTMFYIIDILERIKIENNMHYKITTLAKGIPIGSEIDYLDEGTIIASIKNREIV
jgi:recombination protein RecR